MSGYENSILEMDRGSLKTKITKRFYKAVANTEICDLNGKTHNLMNHISFT